MALTLSHPEVITTSLPDLDMKGEARLKDYDFTSVTHIVVHLYGSIIQRIDATANTSLKYDNEDYLNIVARILSLKFFGNQKQLEWLDTEGKTKCGFGGFVAFTNVEKKMEQIRCATSSDGKLEVVEVMFMNTNPRETQKAFWRPARAYVTQRVEARVKQSLLEMVRLRVMWTRLNVSPRKLQRLRKSRIQHDGEA